MKTDNHKQETQKEKLTVKAFRRLSVLFGRVQTVWAEWMNRKTAGLSKRTLYISLFLFIGFSIAYNSMVLLGTSSQVGFGNIKTPIKVAQPKAVDDVYKSEIKKVKRFTKVMDSLYRSPAGRKTYDSIMKARPGLLDSARAMQQLIDKF
ncbi:hypothetical protein [Fluviicola sp.]|uniref:hypothetical protein n=1 Tax=Fluviicola sp. TaxID=1917219 RepID=UPI0031DFF9B7